ncbi:MAG: carboxypeptidase regulatory-like domain-containing protein, partial [Blastocatellia bacterium]
VLVAAFLTVFPPGSVAQETRKEPSGSVSGRVTVGDGPVPRAVVVLSPSDRPYTYENTPSARATADEDGHYRLTGVPAGSYNLCPYTPAFVVDSKTSFGQPGKSITIGDGEEIDGMDFSLTRGGVIAGQVFDADGRPVCEQRISLVRLDERGQKVPLFYFNSSMFNTDDRGAYRVYGLMPGHYKVSVGDLTDGGSVRIGFGGSSYARTFHPDVTEESRATLVEVTSGGEATNRDIRLGRPSKSFAATGRIVDAETGKPLASLQYGHGTLSAQQTSLGSYGWTNNRTNENGEFRLENLNRGRYAAFVVATEQVDFYSEPAVFEVGESDVSGLEIKVRRGSSINGIAVIENGSDPEAVAKISSLFLAAFIRTDELSAPNTAPARINPDGTFRITGLRPGKAQISFSHNPSTPKGFSLLRLERDGALQRDGIEIGPAETVTGVRVVLGYGTGVIRGTLTPQPGQVTPPEMSFRVSARKLNYEPAMTVAAPVDTRGHFTLQGLLPGEYEIVVNAMFVAPSPPGAPSIGRVRLRTLAKQNVTVTNGADAVVTLVVDLATKDKEGEK